MNEEAQTGGSGSFVSRFVWTIQSPSRLFADVAEGAPWWQPWVWVSLIQMVIAYLSIPIQIQITRLNPRGLPAEQLQQTIEGMEKFGYLGIISTPVVILLSSVIIAGISYLVLGVLAEESRFKTYLTVYLYASIVSSIGLLLGTFLTRMKGVETIRSLDDAVSSFGPALFVSADDKILRAVLSSLDVFQIWFYVLLGWGAMSIFGLSKRSAFFVVAPVWLVFVLIGLVASGLSA